MKKSVRSKSFLFSIAWLMAFFFLMGGTNALAAKPAKYKAPKVLNMNPDPEKSFWKTYIQYPYPVKFAKCKDTRGEEWEIGYMDEYAGKAKDPKVFVIVHGKGACAGHYSELMKYALSKGMRVIAVDMPHYGMSSPANVDKSPARTLDDCRATMYDLVVKQLGVKKAYYHGHSLGGQIVIGYAYKYPDAVAGLVLEGTAGLEEFPTEVDVGGDKPVPMFDPSYAYDYEKWKETWAFTGMLDQEMAKTCDDIKLFYYFKKKDKDTGKIVPDKAGYFHKNPIDAQFLTDQRCAIIKGNKKEFDQANIAFIRDVYSMGIEMLKVAEKNILKQLEEIKSPIFVAYGADEPFLPSKAITGNQSLKDDVVKPFVARMAAVGNKPVVKFYPKVGHFIHTDVVKEFNEDTLDFILKGKVKNETKIEAAAPVAGKAAEKEETKKPSFSK